MNANAFIQIALYIGALLLLIKPLGIYMAKVYSNDNFFASRLLKPVENFIYRISNIDPLREMSWKSYCFAVLGFNLLGFFVLYGILRLQNHIPLNPQNLPAISPDLAFNTAASFITNSDWQSYSGESTMSYFSQMMGLTLQNFLSAATGMSVLAALIRGFARKKAQYIGNFWADMVRSNLYILLPLSIILSILLVSQGVIQNTSSYTKAAFLEAQTDDKGHKIIEQTIPLGLVASQVAIKQIGTNGGGFFNTNSAHPFENPTPFSNFLEMLAILLIPAGLCYTYGKMLGDTRQGWAILAAMLIILIPAIIFCVIKEQAGNPTFPANIDQIASEINPGGNMEGKETRLGTVNSAIWAVATTAASNGSVNSMHDSFTPLGGMAPLMMMQFSEVIFGGAGSGLYGMVIYILVAVFMAGLMVGRTPEYLNKKINVFDIKMASFALLVPAFLVLLGSAIAVIFPAGKTGVFNPGAQGFSEIIYNITSAGNNNGSAFAGLNVNTPFYNILLGIIMLFSRFWIIVPVLAIAGSFAGKNTIPQSAGTLPTHTPLFVSILVGTIILIGVLTFVPSTALGPIVEHLHMVAR